jgi:hypothetical protein
MNNTSKQTNFSLQTHILERVTIKQNPDKPLGSGCHQGVLQNPLHPHKTNSSISDPPPGSKAKELKIFTLSEIIRSTFLRCEEQDRPG